MTTDDSQAVAPDVASAATRPMVWSIRRELWENRSLYFAPLAIAAVLLLGFWISTMGMSHRRRAVLQLDAAHQRAAIEMPYDAVAGIMIVAAFIVGFFYCLDALYGERRDRSILFWKSLPVSDLTTVLAKASMPLVMLPMLIFAIIVILHLLMLMLSTAVLLGSDPSLAATTRLPLVRLWLALLYALVAIALWHAPIYGWLLLVSSWARRAAFLWATLPLVTIAVFERIAFNSSHFGNLLHYRLGGWFQQGFVVPPKGSVHPLNPLESLTPGRFLSTPGLWIGLAFAAIFLAGAVRLRRDREPI